MKKLAFLVEQKFIDVHVGIRNYIFSIYHLLNGVYDVDIVHTYKVGDSIFFSRIKVDKSFIENNGFSADIFIDIKERFSFDVEKLASKLSRNDSDKILKEVYYQSLGSSIDNIYDVVVITNPWMINFEKRIKANILIGMVHDTIPIEYSLQWNIDLKNSPLIQFANLHRNGFNYYNSNCDFILFSSQKSLDGYLILYQQQNNISKKCKVTPPIVSNKFYNLVCERQLREYLVLATPFEKRKGVDYLPDIINCTKNVKKILIFGDTNRCEVSDVNKFFRRLRKDFEVLWYKKITTDSLISIMQKSKLMLFASKDEGLGLPVIEAELCGCKVISYDVPPINQNIVSNMKYYLSFDSHATSANSIDRVFLEPDDSLETKVNANKIFGQKNVLDFFRRIID